jgi:class 3 adenylate cyclase
VTCPVCGTVTVPGAHFCHNCGAALPAAASVPAAERRIVTVLFGDLSDFTAWSESVDPERVGAVTDRVLAALAGAVKTFGGHVDKLTGDGIMAVFGAPVAHEDDPSGRCGPRWRCSARAPGARRRARWRRSVRPADRRQYRRSGRRRSGVVEYTVIGDTVNTAARLADSAAVAPSTPARDQHGDPARGRLAAKLLPLRLGEAPRRRGVRAARSRSTRREPDPAWATRGRSSAASPSWRWWRAAWWRR